MAWRYRPQLLLNFQFNIIIIKKHFSLVSNKLIFITRITSIHFLIKILIISTSKLLQQGRAQKFEKGGGGEPQFPAYTFPLKISVKIKKKVFRSSDVQFTPQNQVKTKKKKGQRVLRCPVSTVSLTADIFQGGRRARPSAPPPSPPLDTPMYRMVLKNYRMVLH